MALSSVRMNSSSAFSCFSEFVSSVSFCAGFGFSSEGFLEGLFPHPDKKNSSNIVTKAILSKAMDFDIFLQVVPKIKNLPLPGEASHFKMAPEMRVRLMKESSSRQKTAKKAGVMVLFYPDDLGLAHLLLIVRKAHPKDVHSGQVGFPGGQVEPNDRDLMYTALRETEEEVGVPVSEINVIRSMSQLYIPPSNFLVFPFMGFRRNNRGFRKQASEVEALIEVPLAQLMDDTVIFHQNLSTSYATDISVPAFKLEGYTVWGATAMMLSEIKELLGQVV